MQVTQIYYPRGGTEQQLCPIQPRGEIHDFNPTALEPQTPQNDGTGPPKLGEGSPLPFHTKGRPGVLPLMATDP